jgi:hypothetical protein
MKKLAIPIIFLLCFSLSAFPIDEITYPRKSTLNSEYQVYHVPSDYRTIQSAVNAAKIAGGINITIMVEEGEYREAVIATGLKNLTLIGKKARILPPLDFVCSDPPVDDNSPSSSIKFINCENFRIEGFTFIGDDFEDISRYSYPMSCSILSYNSSGTITNNIIFNYFDGISFQVNDPRWMKGEISDNFIHNCLWSGIFASGSHDLRILKNRIAFTIPKELSISVGIWIDGGVGVISENHVSSYKAADFHPQQRINSSSQLWPVNFHFTEHKDYQVIDNTIEQSAAGTQFSKTRMTADQPGRFLQRTYPVNNHFINVDQHNNSSEQSEIIVMRPD